MELTQNEKQSIYNRALFDHSFAMVIINIFLNHNSSTLPIDDRLKSTLTIPYLDTPESNS